MKRILRYTVLTLVLLLIAGLLYGAKGFVDGLADAEDLRLRAARLIGEGKGADALGEGQLDRILQVQDPAFPTHYGVDFTTPGAGATTITQSAAKHLAFDDVRPGLGKLRQTGYALAIETRLSKDQILALWLDTVDMGQGPDGWMTGLFAASAAIYGHPPEQLTDPEFTRLIAVLIAPGTYDLVGDDPALDERIRRIERLQSRQCVPLDHGDVWFAGCR